MRILYAVVTCEKRKAQAQAQRDSWMRHVQRADVRFFLARQRREPREDEVFVDVDDSYSELPAKVREVSRWALDHLYQAVLKLDDDVVLFPSRVVVPSAVYAGWKQFDEEGEWCSGLAYWLREPAMRVIATSELTGDPYEDRWTGKALSKGGIRAEGTNQIRLVRAKAAMMPHNLQAQLAQVYAAGEFTPTELLQVYR